MDSGDKSDYTNLSILTLVSTNADLHFCNNLTKLTVTDIVKISLNNSDVILSSLLSN